LLRIQLKGDSLKDKGLLFIIAAPSGAGKTSLCKALLERLEEEGEHRMSMSVSYTTRKPREGEVHGRDYYFVDDVEFEKMIGEASFAEWANVHGKKYGTSSDYLEKAAKEGRDLLVEIDIQGARQLRESFKEALFIFVLPPSFSALKARLKGRGTESEQEVERRLETAKKEVLDWEWFDYIIVNDDFKQAVERMRAVVVAGKQSRKNIERTARLIVDSFRE